MGSYDLIASRGLISNINITTTTGEFINGSAYGDPLPISPGNSTVMLTIPDASAADYTGQPRLNLQWTPAMTPTGGTVSINFAGGFSFEGVCLTDDCFSTSISRRVVQGVATTTPDVDGDGVLDASDNCLTVANANQIDADGDGFGNACDADFNNDCVVNVVDLGLMRSVFFTTDAVVDLNGDGIVNVIDLGLLRSAFFAAPGPSGVASCP